jgi:hypothetical protein
MIKNDKPAGPKYKMTGRLSQNGTIPTMKVVVRSRPGDGQIGSSRNVDPRCASVEDAVSCNPKTGTRLSLDVRGAKQKFDSSFDAVLGPESTQFDAFAECGQPVLDSLFDGYNASLFAYGQTGSGKTFSMLGGDGGQKRSSQDGIIPLLADKLFCRIAAATSSCTDGSTYEVRASFLEVYKGKALNSILRQSQSRPRARPADDKK